MTLGRRRGAARSSAAFADTAAGEWRDALGAACSFERRATPLAAVGDG
jgi:hypothetical protein